MIENFPRPGHFVNNGPFEGGSPGGGSLFVWFEGIIKCKVRDQMLAHEMHAKNYKWYAVTFEILPLLLPLDTWLENMACKVPAHSKG